jgi:alanyl-tRNA synthetase
MQQHSGQHLLSAVFQELFGWGTLSVHFGAESSTLDLDAAALDPEQIRTVEQRANAMVFENREVSAAIEDAAHVSGLRKASTRTGALRVVSIAGLDRSACGGTHVRRTGEIGPILLRRLDRVRKNVRIEFLCGGRATQRARADYEALSRLSGLLSTSIDELPALLGTRLAEFAQQGKQLRELGAQLDELRARELYSRARAARSSDADLACHFERRVQGTLQELRGLGQSYASQPRGVFVGVLEDPPSLLLAASEDSGVDAAALIRGALGAGGGRGGGTARQAQGTLPHAGALDAALAVIRTGLGLPANSGTTAS